MPKRIIVPAIAEKVIDEVVMVVRYHNGYMEVVTAQCELDGDEADRNLVLNNSEKTTLIGGNSLSELRSANPSWNNGKDINYYGEDDIIEVIDRIESGILPVFKAPHSGLI